MSTLRDFIEKRRAEIAEALKPLEAQRSAIDAQISALTGEMRELDSAGAAIGMVNGLHTQPVDAGEPQKPTIKEAVVEVLKGRDGGLVALDILREVNDRFDLAIERTSLSPQLSRLKNDGIIDRRGMVWFFVNKNRTPEARPTPTSVNQSAGILASNQNLSRLMETASSVVGRFGGPERIGQMAEMPKSLLDLYKPKL